VRPARARDSLALLARLHFAAEPEEMSLLYALHALQAGSGLVGSEAFAGREVRVVGGAQRLAQRLAEGLGERVLLGRPVARIEQTSDTVTISCTDPARTVHRARFAILAMPPAVRAGLDVTPPWPAAAAALHRGSALGPVIKHVLAYERPFWRERGLSGEVYDARGPVSAVVDHTDADGAQPALQAFVLGAQARRLSTLAPAARHRVIVEALVAALGPEAGQPVAHAEHDWVADPLTAGCVGILAPGALGRHHDALRAPVGRIHLAGSETAVRWPSYMDGAVEAGERAAAEVLARLIDTRI
jgi:monoamine oxidase